MEVSFTLLTKGFFNFTSELIETKNKSKELLYFVCWIVAYFASLHAKPMQSEDISKEMSDVLNCSTKCVSTL